MTDDQTPPQDNASATQPSTSRGFLKPKKPSVATEKPEVVIVYGADRKAAMRSLEPFERKLGYAAAVLALIFGTFYSLVGIFTKHQPIAAPVKGKCALDYTLIKGKDAAGKVINVCSLNPHYKQHYVFTLVVMVVFSLSIAVAARMKRRVALAFTVLMSGFALSAGAGLSVAVPFILMGGWLMLRAWRMQKFGTTDARTVAKLNAQARADRKNGVKPSFAEPSSRSSAKASTSKTSASTSSESKRYTPKKPAPKKPTPPPAPKPQSKVSKWLKGDESA